MLKSALTQVDKLKESRENEIIMSPEQFQKIAQAIGQEKVAFNTYFWFLTIHIIKLVPQNSKTKSKQPVNASRSAKKH